MAYFKERHLFPGANTSKGFYSFYNYILSQEDANRILCIKGAAGTGKSFLMKKIGTHFSNKGYRIEYHHSSTDINSLEAIVILDLNLAIINGSFPNLLDPLHTGVIDEILNMNDAINTDSLLPSKDEIVEIQKKINKSYSRAYYYLASAKAIHDDWSILNSECLTSRVSTITESLKEEIFNSQKYGYGGERHLFATAFTPNGVVTFIDNLISDLPNKFILSGGPGLGKTDILNKIGSTAKRKGYFVEYFHDPLIPDRIEHILIPELSTCILTTNEISKTTFKGKIFNISDFCNPHIISLNKNEIENCSKLYYDLIDKGISLLKEAQLNQHKLANLYIASMDFSISNNIFNNVVDKFEKFETI